MLFDFYNVYILSVIVAARAVAFPLVFMANESAGFNL